ncbi:hypothetical protein BraRD5C2_35820 [Bradyrhizobium sp. RD5-C2]|nr:hypothetical protein BraRD5C2_35820 [Bradyrhizobium sp. RD5-C2]
MLRPIEIFEASMDICTAPSRATGSRGTLLKLAPVSNTAPPRLPEPWCSRRHQLKAPAEAGYDAVAPDRCGYGRTGKPPDIDQYTFVDLVGDMVGVVSLLDYKATAFLGWPASAR